MFNLDSADQLGVAGGYAVINIGVIKSTGKSIGTHLDDFVSKNTKFKDGVLMEFY